MTSVSFRDLGLGENILRALEDVGYENPSPIQAAAIPTLLEGRDLLGLAQTGTGKTAAFALPLLQNLDLKAEGTQALVLAPTRELCLQVAEALKTYAAHMDGFHVLPVYGGQDIKIQLRLLQRKPRIVVGTPGRIMDHLERGSLKIDTLHTLVLDEADEMLRMGFIEDVEWILEHAPEKRQIALFSATMPEVIRRVANRHLHNPVEVKIPAATQTVEAVEQFYWRVQGLNRLDALTRLLETEDFEGVLIFARTKNDTLELAKQLEARGYACAALNGDLSQPMREKIVESLRGGRLDVVVATDVAARGLDVKSITHVVNYDLPTDVESYVHRIGRTGRAGRKGKAILFASPRQMRLVQAIERATRQPMKELRLPGPEAVTLRRQEKLKTRILELIKTEDLKFFRDTVQLILEEEGVELHDVASALVYLAQEKRPMRQAHSISEDRPHHEDGHRKRRDRGERGDRGDRGERNSGERSERRPRSEYHPDPEVDGNQQRYRVEVGGIHGATTRELVGAIANEAGLEGRQINNIRIYADYSLIDLPAGLPETVIGILRKTKVRQKALKIVRFDGSEEEYFQERAHKTFEREGTPFRRGRKKSGPPRKGSSRPH